MSEREVNPEPNQEYQEFSFDEGVEQAMMAIQCLLETQDYVVVGIGGPHVDDTNVGKTTLSSRIVTRLVELRSPNVKMDDYKHFDKFSAYQLRSSQENEGSNKGVVIFGAINLEIPDATPEQTQVLRENQDEIVRKKMAEHGLPIDKIDLRIFIHRADQPLGEAVTRIADIVIQNDEAREKKTVVY